MVLPSPPLGLVVRTARVVPALPDEAFRALTDPGILPLWWGRTEKLKLVIAEVEPRAGGRFRFQMQGPEGQLETATGAFLEVHRPRQLRLLWTCQSATITISESHVTVEFMDLNDGSTRVVVTHEGLRTPSAASVTQAGWSCMIQDLGIHFSGR